MAEKRMFTKTIVDSDVFLDMPQSAQNLYFHLNMRADDEGFINSPRKIMRMVSSNQNDMDILLAKRYLLGFDSGVVVVKHWKMHNAIRADRLKETMYLEEKASLSVKENGSYTDNIRVLQPSDNQVTTKCPHRLDKIRLEENRIDYKEHFESVWKLYPLKKGKGQISVTKLKTLVKYSIEEWNIIIDRYNNSVTDKNYLMHGSTFFNGGYIDFLDENYEELKTPELKGYSREPRNQLEQRYVLELGRKDRNRDLWSAESEKKLQELKERVEQSLQEEAIF